MQTNLEQFKEMIRSLPLEDFDKLCEVIDEEEQERQTDVEKKPGSEKIWPDTKKLKNGWQKTVKSI